MAATVYVWPPVRSVGTEWTEEAPISVSRSFLTGARHVTGHGRKRRLVSMSVSAATASGAGYCEVLKRLLAGGENLVRLYSCPINRKQRSDLSSAPLHWTHDSVDLEWTHGGTELLWYSGRLLTGTLGSSGGFDTLTITGLTPGELIARAGEFLTVYEDENDTEGETAQILADVVANGAGTAVVRLLDDITHGGRVSFGARDTGVFEALEMPRTPRPVSGNWFYDWSFREVFADEVGGFAEVDPWP